MAVIMIGASSGPSRLGSRSSVSSHHMASSPTSQEVDLYDEQGEEIMDIDISMDADIDVTGDGNLEYGVEDTEKKSKKLIECSARISLPFSVDVAFDAFSDLTRQP